MAKYTVSIVLFVSILLIAGSVEGCRRCSRTRAFVQNLCANTMYPKVCENSLIGHINSTNIGHQQLAQIALRVSLARARFTRAYLTKLASKLKGANAPEYPAIGECIDQINNSVDQLSQSLSELQSYNDQVVGVDDFLWHMSNVETWASSALTDQTNCVQAFADAGRGKNIKAVIKIRVTEVSQVTSNALAMVNRFITRARFNRGIHRP